MVTDELLKYIEYQIQRGIDRNTIKMTLLQNGWTGQDIQEAMRIVTVASAPMDPYVPGYKSQQAEPASQQPQPNVSKEVKPITPESTTSAEPVQQIKVNRPVIHNTVQSNQPQTVTNDSKSSQPEPAVTTAKPIYRPRTELAPKRSKSKAILIGFLTVAIIAGAAGAGYFVYNRYLSKPAYSFTQVLGSFSKASSVAWRGTATITSDAQQSDESTGTSTLGSVVWPDDITQISISGGHEKGTDRTALSVAVKGAETELEFDVIDDSGRDVYVRIRNLPASASGLASGSVEGEWMAIDSETFDQLTEQLFGTESASILSAVADVSEAVSDPVLVTYDYVGRSKLGDRTYDTFAFKISHSQDIWSSMSLDTLSGNAYVDRNSATLSRIQAQATFSGDRKYTATIDVSLTPEGVEPPISLPTNTRDFKDGFSGLFVYEYYTIKNQIDNLLSTAAADFGIFANDNSGRYVGLCDSDEYSSLEKKLIDDFALMSTCMSSATAYAVQIELPGNPTFYSCIDDSGLVRVVSTKLSTTECGAAVEYRPSIEESLQASSSSPIEE